MIILNGYTFDKILQVAVKAMICNVFIVGFVQDISCGCGDILSSERSSVRKTDITAQMKGPDFTAGAFLPAFRKRSLGKIVIIDCNQAFIDYIINGKNISFLRFKRTDCRCFGALDSNRDFISDIFRERKLSGKQKRKQNQD